MNPPSLSLVILTRNEEDNIGNCLASVAAQTHQDMEVIVIDAASTDATVECIQAAAPELPMPIRLEAWDEPIPIGRARNLGVELARAPYIAFLSADADLHERWVEEAVASLETTDLVFGRQVHDPHRWSLGAAVRGLRYRFPDDTPDDPCRLASNVAAAYARDVLKAFPFDDWTNAAEDLLLAQRAREAGFRVTYNPNMIVLHHDVDDLSEEMRKNVREGHALGIYAGELGLQRPVLAWGIALAAAATIPFALPAWPLSVPVSVASIIALLYAPALRRAARRARSMPLGPLAAGVAASPIFDVAFLANYVRGLLDPGQDDPPQPLERIRS